VTVIGDLGERAVGEQLHDCRAPVTRRDDVVFAAQDERGN